MNVLYFPNHGSFPTRKDFAKAKSTAYSEIIKRVIQMQTQGHILNENMVLQKIDTQAKTFENDFLSGQISKMVLVDIIVESIMAEMISKELFVDAHP
ncbi:conserved hypothetical protein [Vibrio crassostreae]|uniref:hypothetical protein n=1 Tax=Vibrio crassostreae TaxID=246167 RepID=UPI000F495169|nr:hypothetical protein [Vibrio crassostreae]ROO64254.1 hypothetical protein EDB58_102135 [Vibrio crassostreae]CAK1876193.1 conserved hypothetical protein [Vibrio crassostreae]CAK2061540.1 conserved hypothetical protein [Vibrio crassostreae]CAK2857650.1 conserved hypothetical protein [Vibrio crassostreae]CAK3233317.1 conserved hypothetical protein [Vibrio crassostreae]